MYYLFSLQRLQFYMTNKQTTKKQKNKNPNICKSLLTY